MNLRRMPSRKPPRAAILLAIAALSTGRAAIAAEPTGPVQFSGVYPNLAALSTSYSESGIGAVAPWADRLWYVSYVAHKSGGGVGLYEITPDLKITRRPESVVGTHAGRMIHRETNQLIIGPYVIDRQRNVRVFRWMAENERITAVMRHLIDPAHKVYFMAMEGKLYEGDLGSLETRPIIDLKKRLGIVGLAHFKGGYTAQGRVVVANNSYRENDQRAGSGDGRLAEWDGKTWHILRRTAFCDVTTARGIDAVPDDRSPLYAIGWDRRSVLLSVLTDGKWSTYRLPKATQAYDHAWCTEWPRIREVQPGRLLVDMHGVFYHMSPEFRQGNTGGLSPLATHLRLVPDFCTWQNRLVMAGDEVISQNHRNRTGGQPQSNLLFTSLDELTHWGPVCGWGGPWLDDQVKAGVPSDPFLVGGFTRRSLHLSLGSPAPAIFRSTGRFPIVELPSQLAGLVSVTIDRGPMERPAPGYSFQVDRDMVAYLVVQDRGNPQLPSGWERTDLKVRWTHGGVYTDSVFMKRFAKGRIDIPPHNGRDERNNYGVPNLCFLAPIGADGGEPEITDLPNVLHAAISRPRAPATGDTTFALEIDRDGRGDWTPYKKVHVAGGGYARELLPDDLPVLWMRITADREVAATAQFYFGPRSEDRPAGSDAIFSSLPPANQSAPRIDGSLMPFAGRLWFMAHATAADGRTQTPGGLYEIGQDMKFMRRGESIPGVFANRKMVGNLLSIGPHLISDDGRVRTIQALAGEHIASTIRHPDGKKMYLLTADGRLLEVDLESLEVRLACNILEDLPQHRLPLTPNPSPARGEGSRETLTPDSSAVRGEMRQETLTPGPSAVRGKGRQETATAPIASEGERLEFKGGHLAGKTVLVAASADDGRSGLLAEWDGRTWKIIDCAAYAEISNLGTMSEAVAAVGWDQASAILKLRSVGGEWSTWRLPKGSDDLDQAYAGDWPRLRETETERMLLDAHGIFYEMSGLLYAWSIRPVATHNRLISDFCSWRGMTVLAGNSAEAPSGSNYVRGDGHAGLWFGKNDDLWRLGRSTGHGGPWLSTPIQAGQPSDPYLMTNFEHRKLELSHDADRPVGFRIEIDFTVQGTAWHVYRAVIAPPGEKVVEPLPDGFSAHWLRITADRDCRATAQLAYE